MTDEERKEHEEQQLDADQEEPTGQEEVQVHRRKVERRPPGGSTVETTEIKRTTKDERLEALQNKDTFKNRRKMAFICLFFLIVVQAWMLLRVPYDQVDKYADLNAWFYGSMVAIVASYMGTTSIPLFMKRR